MHFSWTLEILQYPCVIKILPRYNNCMAFVWNMQDSYCIKGRIQEFSIRGDANTFSEENWWHLGAQT